MARQELRSIGGAYDELHRVLHAWCDLQSKYAAIEGEPAYDNSEAANTSLLVSAANGLYGWTGVSELWVERSHSEKFRAEEGEAKLGRGLLDAYLATETTGHLLELKQAWMVPNKISGGGFKYEGSDPLIKAREQVRQLDYEDHFSNNQNFMSYYGTFLIPSYDPDVFQITRKEAFSQMNEFCQDNFESYAVFSPNLKDRALTREVRKVFRPLVAIGLRIYEA